MAKILVHFTLSRLSRKSGFTLIELSIVLVIIGLLIGGVLVGQDLIHTAQLKKQIKQFQEYQTAFNTFQLKYNCLPGDCINATAFFGTTDIGGVTIYNGNGNGLIDDGNGITNFAGNGAYWQNDHEKFGVFQELGAAGMISFVPPAADQPAINNGVPATILNPAAGFYFASYYQFNDSNVPNTSAYANGNNWLWFNACNFTSYNAPSRWRTGCGDFYGSDIKDMDIKMDDGNPMVGKLWGYWWLVWDRSLANWQCMYYE